MKRIWAAAAVILITGSVFAGGKKETAPAAPVYDVVKLTGAAITLDGTPDEAAWGQARILTDFSYPWENVAAPATTFRALYDEDNFYFSFVVTDPQVLVKQPFGAEKDTVDIEDRVELFFAPATIDKPDTYFLDGANYEVPLYFAVEVDALGRFHDYSIMFYRAAMNSGWGIPGLETAGKLTETGYTVEGKIPLASFRQLGLIQRDNTIIAGVFRAEFSGDVNAPAAIQQRWISWVHPATVAPDFHVATAFGTFRLEP